MLHYSCDHLGRKNCQLSEMVAAYQKFENLCFSRFALTYLAANSWVLADCATFSFNVEN